MTETITEFRNVAGPKLNLIKTDCLSTGSFIDMYSNEPYIHGVNISSTCTKSRGHDKIECFEKKVD